MRGCVLLAHGPDRWWVDWGDEGNREVDWDEILRLKTRNNCNSVCDCTTKVKPQVDALHPYKALPWGFFCTDLILYPLNMVLPLPVPMA